MPELNSTEIQKIESFLAKKVARKCSVCGTGIISAKQKYFISIPIGVDNKGINLVAGQCDNCAHITFWNYDTIVNQ